MAIAAHQGQPAIRTPGPVANDRIDETGNGNTVEEIADKSGPADHRSGSDCGAGIRKSKLEDPDGEERDACGFVGRRCPLQEEPVISNESIAVAEHEGKADGIEENAAKTGIYNAFHEYVDGFARTTESGLQHGEANLHAENQEGSNQRPGRVDGIDDVSSFDLRIGGIDAAEDEVGHRGHDDKSQPDAH